MNLTIYVPKSKLELLEAVKRNTRSLSAEFLRYLEHESQAQEPGQIGPGRITKTKTSHSVVTPKNWGEATFILRGTGTLVIHRFSSKLKRMIMRGRRIGGRGWAA